MGMKPIILASASPRRMELLKQIGLDFQIIPSEAPEVIIPGHSPEEAVMELAAVKARNTASASAATDGFVIGADTVVVFNGEILGKPVDSAAAARMLSILSGREHSVFTGVAVLQLPEGKIAVDFAETRVVFRRLSRSDIENYIATGEPFDKAGAYGIQGRGALLVEKINGCYFNVVGLPLGKLADLFLRFGVSLV